MSKIATVLTDKICFATLALGKNYRTLAKVLAKDIEKYAPQIPFVILTDKPDDFTDYSNVLAFKHHQQSIGCYHDKRFVIAKGLSLFNSCIFIDADMRILAPVQQTLECQPGITSHTVWTNILKHNKKEFEIKLLSRMAEKLNLNLEEISFVHECLFIVTKDSGKEQEFLKQWDRIAPYFELNGFYRGEGHTIGLAAAKAGLMIKRDSMNSIPFFKDKLEINKIKKDQPTPNQILELLEIQKRYEYPSSKFVNKVISKINKTFTYMRCLLYWRIVTIKNFKFYYL
ncbi:MAG: hypothetical protein QNJ70_13795 [Xenococcaceae cyanobacterium MO_207.B15]|nr:hypothetical protein [Xenococcaceae cyanobacterium MO_207.B15]